jgi:hypothetical protein
MEILVDSLNKDTTNEDEMDELVRDVRVRFESQKAPPEITKKSDPSDALQKALAANGGGPTRKKKSSPPPVMWFGLIGTRHGVKWITANVMEAHEAATKKKCKIHQVYSTREEAEAWLEEEDSDEAIPDHLPRSQRIGESDNDSSVPDSRVSHRQAKNKARKKQRMREAKKSKDSKEEKAKKSARSRSQKKKPHKQHKQDDDSGSSSNGSDSEDGSSDSESMSSSSS